MFPTDGSEYRFIFNENKICDLGSPEYNIQEPTVDGLFTTVQRAAQSFLLLVVKQISVFDMEFST